MTLEKPTSDSPSTTTPVPTEDELRDIRRELGKVYDTVRRANDHFRAEGQMNAALHMSDTVRPAPLAAAMEVAQESLIKLIARLAG